MSDNNNRQVFGDKEGENMEPPPPPRERSPSAMSQSSGVLEWDPSADVGAMGGAAGTSGTTSMVLSQTSSTNQLSALKQVRDCNAMHGSAFDLDKSKRAGHLGGSSTSSHSLLSGQSRILLYSTPSSSPVPLTCLQSPISSQYSGSRERKSDVKSKSDSKSSSGEQSACTLQKDPNIAGESTDDNNNDEVLTEGRRTLERNASEASTDWEYDNEKHLSSKSLSQWQTSGMTRSEIEYQNRKNSGSSTSVTSSVFLLQVEANVRSQGSAEERPSKSDRVGKNEASGGAGKTRRSNNNIPDLERKLLKNISRHHASEKFAPKDIGSSDSDPSSMCVVINDFLKLAEGNPSKENMRYDVLKRHRDYHMIKVWKQISKLEKLNRALLTHKRGVLVEDKRRAQEREREDLLKQVQDGLNIRKTTRDYDMPVFKAKSSKKAKDDDDDEVARLAEAYLEQKKLREREEVFQKLLRQEAELKDYSCASAASKSKLKDYSSEPSTCVRSERRDDDGKRLHSKLSSRGRSYPVLNELLSAAGVFDGRIRQENKSEPMRQSQKELEELNITATELKRMISSLKDLDKKKKSVKPESEVEDELNNTATELEELNTTATELKKMISALKDLDKKKKAAKPAQPAPKPQPPVEKPKSPVGFYIPLFDDERIPGRINIEKRKEQDGTQSHQRNRNLKNDLSDFNRYRAIEDYLRENKPHIYETIKERDNFLINMKRDRQVHSETILREAVEAELSKEELEDFLDQYYKYATVEERKRIAAYYDWYIQSKKLKGPNRGLKNEHVISTREMRERTNRLRMNDPVLLEKRLREAEERRRQASRHLQKKFSTNLRRYQKQFKVNVPDRMKIGPPKK